MDSRKWQHPGSPAHRAPVFQRLASVMALACGAMLIPLSSGAQPFFTDVTDEIGVPLTGARSTAFGDYDNDGWPDMFCAENWTASPQGRVSLLHNDGYGRMEEDTGAIEIDLIQSFKGGGSIFGDYDNDGDLDLFVSVGSWRLPGSSRLLRNDRGVFVDVTAQAGLIRSLPTDNAIWLDYNLDGFLDLYLGNLRYGFPTLRNILHRNNGDGTFTDVTGQAGLDLQLNTNGGSNGGMAAGDFNSDGWPDLYVGVFREANRLFLNDGEGHFSDATSSEIGHPGDAFGVAIGDIDNDGDLDIFQAAGGAWQTERSVLLLNLGEAVFLDATELWGLSALGDESALAPSFADIDNDGDLDLLIADPGFLFLNNGEGLFEDKTPQWGVADDVGGTLSLSDYNRDGFLDIWFGDDDDYEQSPSFGRLYLNNGNGNHWLQVELAGVESNRNGIGTRLWAHSGDLRQMREITAGNGFYQDEMIAHFGLGQHTQLDELEIRWPSGQVDVLTDVPADQVIRVFEGRETYYVVEPTTWDGALTDVDTLVVGSSVDLSVTVVPSLYEPEAEIIQVVADLSAAGGPTEEPLRDVGDGTYVLEMTVPDVAGPNRLAELAVTIDQSTSLGPHWVRLSKNVAVVPGGDLALYDEVVAPGWEISTKRVVSDDPAQTEVVRTGITAWALQAEEHRTGWHLYLDTSETLSLVGYDTLSFHFHPGDVAASSQPYFRFRARPGGSVYLLENGLVDLERKEWQRVVIPVSSTEFWKELVGLWFSGSFGGTFYLDDIRLIAARPGQHPGTAVTEERSVSLPSVVSLAQNYPNPFNSSTTIRFGLPQQEMVGLAIFNLAGQEVVTLAQGHREAGSYTLRWDGRDGNGRELASGVYLYRLQVGGRVETRKLLLLR